MQTTEHHIKMKLIGKSPKIRVYFLAFPFVLGRKGPIYHYLAQNFSFTLKDSLNTEAKLAAIPESHGQLFVIIIKFLSPSAQLTNGKNVLCGTKVGYYKDLSDLCLELSTDRSPKGTRYCLVR